MPLAGGAETVLLSAAVAGRNFVVTGHGIYFMRYSGPAFAIDVYRFDSRTTESVVTLRGHPDMGLAVSRDEKRILYSQVDHEGRNIMLVENYR
jgi:hypothetical protein